MDCESRTWCVDNYNLLASLANSCPGITPFVNPDDLRFFFEEIHKYAASS